jgi:hypothetical protein
VFLITKLASNIGFFNSRKPIFAADIQSSTFSTKCLKDAKADVKHSKFQLNFLIQAVLYFIWSDPIYLYITIYVATNFFSSVVVSTVLIDWC